MGWKHWLLRLLAVAASAFVAATAMAQSGNVGGTIGKKDKVISGDQPAPARRAPPKRNRQSSETAANANILQGHWRIQAECSTGHYDWFFNIRSDSASAFTGEFGPGGGTIVTGTLTGNHISMTTSATVTRSWTATLSRSGGLSMTGSMTGPGSCTFTAKKG